MVKPSTSGYASVNGLQMYYEVHGQGGIPLVLLHGGGSTINSTFDEILPLLVKRGQVIALEMQAHGRTSNRDAPESFEQDADDVATLLQKLQAWRADFFGFSNGGTTSLQIGIRHPDIVNKIVCLSGAARREGFVPGFFESMKGVSLEKNLPAPLKEAFLKVTPDQKKLKAMFDKDVERMIGFSNIPDALLRSISAKVLIMASDRDVITAVHTVEMSNCIAGARLIILPGSHGSCIGTVESEGAIKGNNLLPEITVALIQEFLDKE
jgi:pimeloyl-ACP methyl ester carboxylesterase